MATCGKSITTKVIKKPQVTMERILSAAFSTESLTVEVILAVALAISLLTIWIKPHKIIQNIAYGLATLCVIYIACGAAYSLYTKPENPLIIDDNLSNNYQNTLKAIKDAKNKLDNHTEKEKTMAEFAKADLDDIERQLDLLNVEKGEKGDLMTSDDIKERKLYINTLISDFNKTYSLSLQVQL